ncbi:MAG: PAS domain-containing protein [Nevskiaceae bacterium]|nr:MAG: PAS domain-containing protein [Nevskiaceae bacterium]
MPIARELEFDRARIRSPYLRMLFDYWEKLRGDRAAPDADEIDPLDIPPAALPYIILVDLDERPLRPRYRLVGTHGVQAAGWDYTGKYADELELSSTVMEDVMTDFAYALEMKPMYANYDWPLRGNRGIVNVELVQLPLLVNGVVTRCFCGEHVGQGLDLFSDDTQPLPKAE